LVSKTISSKIDGTLIGVSVSEMDVNNRVVNATISDANGHYVIKIKDVNNKLTFSYIGYDKQIKPITDNRIVNVTMSDKSHEMNTVVVTGKKKLNQGGFSIATREISTAMQTIDMKEM